MNINFPSTTSHNTHRGTVYEVQDDAGWIYVVGLASISGAVEFLTMHKPGGAVRFDYVDGAWMLEEDDGDDTTDEGYMTMAFPEEAERCDTVVAHIMAQSM